MSPVVEQPVKASLISDAPHHKAISVTLRYDGDDPLALRIVFPREVSRDQQREVIWAFSRDLLASGLREPAGNGDVQVWPCGRAQVIVEFHGPEGVAMVQFDTAPLRRFLDSAYALVPVGEEQHAIEMEPQFHTLLHRS